MVSLGRDNFCGLGSTGGGAVDEDLVLESSTEIIDLCLFGDGDYARESMLCLRLSGFNLVLLLLGSLGQSP